MIQTPWKLDNNISSSENKLLFFPYFGEFRGGNLYILPDCPSTPRRLGSRPAVLAGQMAGELLA